MKLNSPLTSSEALWLRLLVGGLFGLAIAWLSVNFTSQDILKTVLGRTLSLAAFVIWAGAGAMRRLSLTIWSIIAFALLAFIVWYHEAYIINSKTIWFILPFLFIIHELISTADQARKIVAPYPFYFDQAWKRSIQLVLALLFTCLFWGLLWLGATLLGFIGFNWLKDTLNNKYFYWIAVGLAMASAVQLGDVQTKLLTNVRTVILGVLAWLLPVITLVGIIFAISLCFSGLAPLWATKTATFTLLSACLILILLINAAYQQGDQERSVHSVLKLTARLASILLLIFGSLAAVSLYLRVNQYGFTPERVLALVGVIISVLFGIGYSFAALLSGQWMRGIEKINISLAVFNVLFFLAILTPIADPARLSVLSQVDRLQTGIVPVEKFDWRFLRFGSGLWGKTALDSLIVSGKTDAIKLKAAKVRAIKDDEVYELNTLQEITTKKPDPKYLNIIFPHGAKLPHSFLDQAFPKGNSSIPPCLTSNSFCDIALVDLNYDQQPEIVIVEKNELYIFTEEKNIWKNITYLDSYYIDETTKKAFKEGKIRALRPHWDQLQIGEHLQTLRPFGGE